MDISGKTLCVLRNLKGLKQGQVSKELGVSQSAYSKLEQLDKVDTEHLNRIIKVMGYSPEEFEKQVYMFQLSSKRNLTLDQTLLPASIIVIIGSRSSMDLSYAF